MRTILFAYKYYFFWNFGLACFVSGFQVSFPPQYHVSLKHHHPADTISGRRRLLRRHGERSRVILTGAAEVSDKAEKLIPSETIDFLEALRDVAFDLSLELLSAVRWGAANALTASLPEEQRQELLNRMGTNEAKPSSSVLSRDEGVVVQRGSVQEEIAAAVAEESRINKERWEKEKMQIAKQMEEAAIARVENELAVQRKRLEKEKIDAIVEMEAEKEQLAAEMMSLTKRLDEQVSIEIGSQELKDMESLLQKRQQQQAELQEVENNLRKRVSEIEIEKEKIRLLQREIEEANVPQTTANGDVDIVEVPYYSPKEYRALPGEEKSKLMERRAAVRTATVTSDAETDDHVHPVLGPVVSDLGYKRIHLVSSGKLGTIKVWNRNRIYRNSRARSMASDKAKTMHLGFPGVICLHEDSNGKLSILDGQHRVGMMAALREKRNEQVKDSNLTTTTTALDDDYMFDQVLVEVYPHLSQSNVSSEEHAKDVFLEINKAEPVKLVDMPGVASSKDRKIITDAVDQLQNQFPKMFSPSQRCRSPNVNVDNMRNNIFGANILKRHKLTTSKKLVDWLLVQNAALGENYQNNEEQREFISDKAWKKAATNDFYLGLKSSWLYK